MNSHKTKQEAQVRKSPVAVETDLKKNVRVLQSELNEVDELALADDNLGGDPYNNTGQHCIVKPRRDG